MAERDLVGYGGQPPDPRWPGGARVAVQFVLNVEEGGERSILNGDAQSEDYLHEMPGRPDKQIKGPASYFPSIEKTYGQSISHWMEVLDAMKDKKHMEMVAALKSEHKMGHGHANALVAYHRAQNEKA